MTEAFISDPRYEFSVPSQAYLKKTSFHFVWLVRSLILCLALAAISSLHPIGTSLTSLSLALWIGTLAGSIQAFRNITVRRSLFYLAILYGLFELVFFVAGYLVPEERKALSLFVAYGLHFEAVFWILALAFFFGMLFWRSFHFVTLECLVIAIGAVYFLSGHRDFNFSEAPRVISDLAWRFGLDNFSMLILSGTALTFVIGFYLFSTTVPSRPRIDREGIRIFHYPNRAPRYVLGTLVVVALLALLAIVSRQVYHSYYDAVLSQTANGVAQFQNSDEAIGKSPLGFHSALGSNNQPSALVRLDGDYRENPTSPMLYLREGALSQLEGNELVAAGKAYDDDITYTSPTERFQGEEDISLLERVPVTHSVYLLSSHDTAFAIDYPLSIVQLQNPAPDRFSAAYKAYSIAPAFSLDSLRLRTPGDPRWSPEKRKHYLAVHPDERYGNLAQEIARGIVDPAEQAFALTEWLSANAIYTLTPNHEVDPGGDPVAPFLFGDMRGYCVHFAHATVYMLRALGIPSRIGTGYLTDLSDSKDGHILLRMSDRHAWAEAYFEGKGWVPFDTQPEQVENHADSDMDFSLLEELMGLVGPDKELFPEDLLGDEVMVSESSSARLPIGSTLVVMLLAMLSLLTLTKLYLRFSWILPASPEKRIERLYRSLLSSLGDLGFLRNYSETPREFFLRVQKQLHLESLSLHAPMTTSKYAQAFSTSLSDQALVAYRSDTENLKSVEWWKRALGFLNPLTAFRFITGNLK